MTETAHRPGWEIDDPAEVILGLLDFYRDVVAAKLDGLSEEELRGSRLPSGWSPIELLKHLVYMEQRWLVWGFTGERDPASPALSWILLHVLQEYARHAGHLDIVRELADGRTGEDG